MLSISSKFGFTFPKIFKTFVVAVTSKKLQSYSTKNIALVDYLDPNTKAAGVKNYEIYTFLQTSKHDHSRMPYYENITN